MWFAGNNCIKCILLALCIGALYTYTYFCYYYSVNSSLAFSVPPSSAFKWQYRSKTDNEHVPIVHFNNIVDTEFAYIVKWLNCRN